MRCTRCGHWTGSLATALFQRLDLIAFIRCTNQWRKTNNEFPYWYLPEVLHLQKNYFLTLLFWIIYWCLLVFYLSILTLFLISSTGDSCIPSHVYSSWTSIVWRNATITHSLDSECDGYWASCKHWMLNWWCHGEVAGIGSIWTEGALAQHF